MSNPAAPTLARQTELSRATLEAMHVFRWDLDRTYLDTQIHSVRGLLRAAIQSASEKRTLPGAASLMRRLAQHDSSSRICVLSGSPTQMREVLQEKLALDGVVVDQLILKDNLGNIRRGRLKAVRRQVGYKLPALLQQRIGLGPSVHETLFGDDSEADALIYAAYAAAVAGRIDRNELTRVLSADGAYSDTIDAALAALDQIGPGEVVEDIFIRIDRGVPVSRFRMLGPGVTPVFSWMQAAIVLWTRGRLGTEAVEEVTHACASEAGHTVHGIAGLFQDTVRRGLAPPDVLAELLERERLAPIRSAATAAIRQLGAARSPAPADTADFVGFLKAVRR